MTFVRKQLLTAISIGCSLLIAISASADVFYVDGEDGGNGSDMNDGSGWLQPFKTLQKAIFEAENNQDQQDQIWVKGSDDGGITYFPDEGPNVTPGDQTASFKMESGVQIFGGFAGDEDLLEQRDPGTNLTILSGDLQDNDVSVTVTLPPALGMLDFGADDNDNDIPDSYEDNTYHVVTAEDVDSTAVLDGFTIRGGNANTDGFLGEVGGGLLISTSGATATSEPTIVNCVFKENRASGRGSAVFAEFPQAQTSSKPQFRKCVFRHNKAATGGAIDQQNSKIILIDCAFFHNGRRVNGRYVQRW